MKAVMAFAGKAKSMATAAQASQGGQSSTPFSGKTMGNMSRGLSILGSLSEYAGQRQQAASLDQQARDEATAGRQEYIQASERVTAIDDAYNRLVGDQLVAATGMNIDVGSGSVIAARQAAQANADRERTIIRNSADANAKVRRVRSLAYREGAKNQRFGATVKLGLDVASAFAS